MKEKFTYQLKTGPVFVHCIPNTCPHCNKSISPVFLAGNIIKLNDKWERIDLVFECPDFSCQKKMIAEYIGITECFIKYPSAAYANLEIPEVIETMTPRFGKIYNEALHVKHLGLNEIAGPGLRKALEILLIDYSKHTNKLNAEEMKKLTLSEAIKKLDFNPQLQKIADRCAWLGNDQTHYDKKHPEQDLDMFFKVADLLYKAILQELETEQAIEKIEHRK